jgi:colanic acid/amylovoran biosynthesis protein
MGLKLDLPIIFLAHSIGPFKTQEEAEAWTNVARQAMLITIREPASYRYVTQDLGLPEDSVHLTADVAFLLEACPPPNAASWRDAYRISRDRPLVAVAPSRGITGYAQLSADTHIDAWVRVIERLVQDMGAEVIVIPHVQTSLPDNDDRIIATTILKRLSHPERVTLAGWDHSAAEFKGIISECELVIGERMHACIAGLSSGVPTVAVGYSVKANGVMSSVFGEEVDRLGVLVSVERFLEPAYARTCVGNAWENRKQLRGILAGQQNSLRDAALSNFVLLREALHQRGVLLDADSNPEYGERTTPSHSISAVR